MSDFVDHSALLPSKAPMHLGELFVILAFGLLYLAAASASLIWIYPVVGIALIWPVSGLALAVVLSNRISRWPVIISVFFVANLCANLLAKNSLPVSLGFAFANSAETILIASMLVRWLEIPLNFQRIGQVFGFFLIASSGDALSALLGAGTAALALGANFWQAWFGWWLTNGLGIGLVLPLILAWMPASRQDERGKRKPTLSGRRLIARWLEKLLIAGCAIGAAAYLFLHRDPQPGDIVLRTYLLFPFFIWGSLRFTWRYVSGLLLLTSVIAIYGTFIGLGQFSGPGIRLESSLLGVQMYLGVLNFTMIVLNAIFIQLKMSGERLATSEAGYRSLFENASIGIFHSEPGAGFLKVNPSLANMLGYGSPEELLAEVTNIPTQLYVDSLDYEGTLKKTFLHPGWTQAVNRYRRKDGSLMVGQLSVRKVHAEDGSLAYLEGFVEDITESRRIELALLESSQEFRSIVDSAPTAMQLYKLQEAGSLMLTGVNPASERMFGIQYLNLLGQTLEQVVPELAKPEFVELCARVARRELHDQAVEFYSQAVQTEGFYDVHVFETSPGCIAIDFVDITERKLSEQIAQARIRLFEFSATHSLEDLLRATLDEAEALTGSQIGFYHFLEADQTTLWLQNWSTRTVESYCKAEGKGSHYPVRQAGVWVDCIQARGPVIHNDYASLPHRKGLPAGHAELIRELVVPVMRGDSIVAILGVGNKPWDYSKRDVEMVNKLADLAWDITGRKRAELALQKSESLLNESQSLSLVGGWEYDNLTQKITWTREVYRIYGVSEYFDPNDIASTTGFYAPEDQRLIEDAFARACQDGQPYDLELRFVNTQGTALWVRTQGNPLVENGKVVRVTGNIMDITASKQAEEHLRQLNSKMARQLAENEALRAMLLEQSTHDALTGLFNRRYMDDSLERELARAQREAYPVSILMIDIDYFKRFNDNHGHSAGDQVLIGLGHLLHASVRESDIPCRYGGEEFIIILPQANLRDALVRAEQIRQDFSNLRIEALPNEISPTLSVGVAAFPEHGASIDRLIQAADRALYAAKAAGRNCISLAEVG